MDRPGCPSQYIPRCNPHPACEHHACLVEIYCPFFDAATAGCQISDASASLSHVRQKFCRSDDYDGCPTYLGFLLRRTRPLRADSDWLDAD